ncbi:MAG: hypothetical protein V7776_05185 [Halopseudomonas aestusnigri]
MENIDTTTGALQISDNKALQVIPAGDIFSNIQLFEDAQRMCSPLSESDMVPDIYKKKKGNVLIAMDMARRLNASPLMVMQNLNIIHGRPSLASQMVIACLNSCNKFSPIRYRIKDLGKKKVEYIETYWENKVKKYRKVTTEINDTSFIAYATDLASGEEIEGPEVTVEMAVLEGWYGKVGSKWQTMPGLMGRYRSAGFFGRLYAPEVTMGMPTDDEVIDVGPQEYTVTNAPDLAAPTQEPDEEIEEVEVEVVEPEETAKAEPEKDNVKEPAKRKPRATKPQLDQAYSDGRQAFKEGKFDKDYSEICTSDALKKKFMEGHHAAQNEPVEESPAEKSDAPFEAPGADETPTIAEPSNEDDGDWGFGE